MLIVSNWKAYVDDAKKVKALFAAAKRLASKKVQIVLAPSAPYVGFLALGNRSKVSIGVQDISDSTGGAATGELTAGAAKGAGAAYAIVGHSERRARGESDALVLSKTQHALAQGLKPILCIGEHERDTDGRYLQFIRAQLAAVFAPLSTQERAQIIVAYEPIWAIGKTAADAITPSDLQEMMLYIRKVLAEYVSGNATVLYGGSVESGNIASLASGVDGFLIGHASTDVQEFTALVKALS